MHTFYKIIRLSLFFTASFIALFSCATTLLAQEQNHPTQKQLINIDLPEVTDLVADHATVQEEIMWQGISRPSYDAQLSFAVPGIIYSIDITEGSRVKAGQLLMSLDTRAEDQRLALLEAEINNTIKRRVLETQRAQARLDMERFRTARKHNAATGMEVQHAEVQYKLATLALEEENFRIKQLGLNRQELLAQREKMRLYAPCNGIVEDIAIERGMAADKNLATVHLVSIDPMLVELNLPVDIANALHKGDTVDVIMTDGSHAQGTITHKTNIAVLSSRTLRIHITVPNPENRAVGLLVKVRR